MEIKKTPVHAKHLAFGAKMMPFAGFDMPVRYAGDKEEHMAVRNAVGVFDVSHMGEFIISGPEAWELIQYVSSNDVLKLEEGGIQYACLPNDRGGIVDDLLIYKINDELYLLVVNASNIEKDFNWIFNHNTFNAEVSNVSDNYALFAVQGPKSVAAIQSLTDVDLAGIKYYTFEYGTFAGVEDVMISATGYTGAGGFEIMVPVEDAEKVWDAIFEAGKPEGIQPIGLGARDTLRLEKGYCLYGNDIDESTNPIEAGLGWVTKFNKTFLGKDFAAEAKENGPKKKLVGFKMIDKGLPRGHYPIFDTEGNAIGEVTSGSLSPVLNVGIGLGYVQSGFALPGTQIKIGVRNKFLLAEVSKLPFV